MVHVTHAAHPAIVKRLKRAEGHLRNVIGIRRAWWVIGLCAAMMLLEILGGLMFGSIALVADGLDMSTDVSTALRG
jgi:Co/Zn/Cd efflux system component